MRKSLTPVVDKDQYALPLIGGGSGFGWKALPLFKAANDILPVKKASGE